MSAHAVGRARKRSTSFPRSECALRVLCVEIDRISVCKPPRVDVGVQQILRNPVRQAWRFARRQPALQRGGDVFPQIRINLRHEVREAFERIRDGRQRARGEPLLGSSVGCELQELVLRCGSLDEHVACGRQADRHLDFLVKRQWQAEMRKAHHGLLKPVDDLLLERGAHLIFEALYGEVHNRIEELMDTAWDL